MIFQTIPWNGTVPANRINEIFLRIDRWNDYSFVTMFQVYAYDELGHLHDLGSVKIGFTGQTTEQSTYSRIVEPFESLGEDFFSLGLDVGYYRLLGTAVSREFREEFCKSMRDIVFDTAALERARGEDVFRTSLLRDSSLSVIKGQYLRVLSGGVPLTNFNLEYEVTQTDDFGGLSFKIDVEVGSKPRTNVHAIIGRNGVGKTTLLNDMIAAAIDPQNSRGKFFAHTMFSRDVIADDYFSSVISISFSAFDPFNPPLDRPDPESGPAYHYVGLKDNSDITGSKLKNLNELYAEISRSLLKVFSESSTRERWLNAIKTLESDENFAAMDMPRLLQQTDRLEEAIFAILRKMSSGHAIVVLIITRLVETVQEKTLVLIDEPESHLHPPLLSALTRSVSDLLFNRNGVAIIATHSPVVLQEVPRICVWKINRSRLSVAVSRPELETFGENVGILTREVFGLEVSKSGFHSVLAAEVQLGRSYDEIFNDYKGQLGFEAQAILRAMITHREANII